MTPHPQRYFKFIDLAAASSPSLTERMERAASRVIRSGIFLHGPETARFEQVIASICEADRCIAVSNGLDAIRLIFRAYMELGEMKPGDEVIVPGNTFIASLLPLSDLGLTPRIIAPRQEDYNISLADALKAVGPKTRAVLPVHLYGTPSWDAGAARELNRRGIKIIEDNAQAIGACAAEPGLRGTYATGGLADASAISFYPTKNLGALGDGGAVVTSDPRLAKAVEVLANYGSDRRYHNIMRGYNNRLDEIQAAMMLEKIPGLADVASRRQATAEAYCATICNPLVTTPRIFPDRTQVWHQYVIRSPHRDRLKEYLLAQGVETDIHYLVPPHKQPCYSDLTPAPGPLPMTERLADEVLSLPIVNATPDDARCIGEIINMFRP